MNDLPFPFQFELEALPVFEQIFEGTTYTYTGMLMRLKRKSLGQLLSGYYYPTATFAFLSMVSFLINPDVVSFNFKFVTKIVLTYCEKKIVLVIEKNF